MAGLVNVEGDPGTWRTARELGKELSFPVGPYEARVPTAEEMNVVLPYIMDRMARFARDKYFCENAEITFAHILGINVPRFGFPDSSGFNPKTGRDWEGRDRDGLDTNGLNREGFNRYGYDRDGFNKDGYNQDGFDKEGFNKEGLDWYGNSREQKIINQVTGWSDDFAAVIAAHVLQLKAAEPVVEPVVTETPKKAAARKTAATAKKGVPTKKAAPKVTVAKKAAAAAAAPKNPFAEVAPRRRTHAAA